MPFCTRCCTTVSSEELTSFAVDGSTVIICKSCVPKVLAPPGLDYELSYSNKKGLKLSATLGTAQINIHVPQEELSKLLR